MNSFEYSHIYITVQLQIWLAYQQNKKTKNKQKYPI